jgi:hypothetical protein
VADGAIAASATARRPAVERSVGHVLGNTAITGIFGSLFWLLAPRVADDEAVAAAVSAASLVIVLGFAGQLNMATALSRFLPQAGPAQRSALRSAYAVSIGVSVLIAVGVIAVGVARGGELVRGGDMSLTIAVAVALPLWTIFALQDGALVALRRSGVLPVENGITSVVRIVMLPLATAVAWSSGLLIVWLVPIVPAIVIVNHWLFSRLLADGHEPFRRRREAVRFALTDLPGVLLTVASLRLVPLVVVEAQGSEAGAHIGVAWSILTVAALALPALSRLVLSELSHEPDRAAETLAHLRRTVMTIVVPVAVVTAAGAPLILRIAGEAYASGGAVVLAAGAFGLVPAALVEVRFAAMRASGHVATVMWIQTGRAIAMIVGTVAVTITGHPLWVGVVFTAINAATLGATTALELNARPGVVGRTVSVAVRLTPGLAGLVMVLFALPRVDLGRIGDAGLISALPVLWFIGAALIVVGAFACLAESGPWRAGAYAHLAVLIGVIHGLPGMVHPHPRFPVAWLHVGFINEIADQGRLFPQIDGRFSWAGFFSGGALLQEMSGQSSLSSFIRFTPVVLNLAAILAIAVIGPLVGATRRQTFVASAIFIVANWIGQDYFAPQAVTFILYLAVVALVLRWFAADPAESLSPRWLRLLRPERPALATSTAGGRRIALVVALMVVAALVMAHQLSPLFLGLALFALAVTQAISLRGLPFLVIGAFVAWLSFSAEAYWVGHLDNIIGSVGEVQSLVKVNVSERSAAPSFARQLVLRSRIALSIGLWLLAFFAVFRLRRQWRTPVALVCLLLAPFPPLFVQPYGGEMIMRVTLFTLPATALLCARLLAPEGLLSRRRRVVLAAAIIAMLPVFVLTRFGNEKFERVSSSDVALAREMYDLIPAQSVVFVRNRQTLVQAERIDEVRFRLLPRLEGVDMVDEFDEYSRPIYVMFTAGQEAFGSVTQGYRDGWLRAIEADLVSTGRFTEVIRHGQAVLLRFEPASGEEEGETS